MAGDVDAGDLMLVFFGESQNVLLGLMLGDRKRGIDIDLVSGGDLVQHDLKRLQIGQRLSAGEYKVTIGGDGIHPPDALADFFRGEARQVRIFPLVDAEGAVVFAVIGDENRHRCAALPSFIGMFHVDRPFRNKMNTGISCVKMALRNHLQIFMVD